ncbi:NAD(P)-dependent dehydrogenase (short-subunit alcohol dehydrogenase family) [Asanoa ferruginea]|uniref:NAD(P)-dependent dehydrogenase (Short-subunit alcohol dehydrogenase family) n=1 Tax=Asanoa ferruginea TaxID=53367 RepID=A0A3D9ZHE2_9ACTN|nr:SDR family NAD(P)-dependent oxidoreductase [Asanoa ferruginea]REF96836.1 NAD(P)-dependent dehydrogenase (short-subunit alcohol dehydrogenase family) [Asanoa ferruginea]
MEEVTGRVVVITGASSGIGLSAAVALARRGDQVVLVGRDPARLAAAASEVRDATGTLPASYRADFSTLDDVRTLAAHLRTAYDRIDVLANNAGAIVLHPATTVDGYELTIQANHLASFLLTTLLHDRIGRTVVTASGAYRWGNLDPRDLNRQLERYVPFLAYGTSKQANILFAGEAARQWPGMLSFSFHPGAVRTRFYNDNRLIAWGMKHGPFLRGPDKGAETLVWLATADPARLVNGGFYYDKKPRRVSPKATDQALAAALWKASEQAVG